MTNRIFTIRFTGILLFVMLLSALKTFALEKNRPNILMIVVDDLNDWVGYMNVHTQALSPDLDQLTGHLPDKDELWDPNTTGGADYNDFFRDIIERRSRPQSE